MKALSVKQPFAHFIERGMKTIETRTWATKYRGDILIHASKKPHQGDCIVNMQELTKLLIYPNWPIDTDCFSAIQIMKDDSNYFTGHSICIATLVDCRPMTEADEVAACCRLYPGAWAWELTNIRDVAKIDMKGSLGLFNVADSILKLL